MVSSTSSIDAELERILKSKWLRESNQLSALLTYVVEQTQAGLGANLKEYTLGIEVFHRPKSYDPRNDAIVRVQASLLRKRLAAYYENEGKDSPLRIEIPRGGYVAEFRTVASPILAPPEPAPRPAPSWRGFAWGALAGALSALLAVAWVQLPPPVAAPSLWGSFLDRSIPAVASFGVPLFYTGSDGLYLRDVQVNSPDEEPRGRISALRDLLQMHLRPQEDVYTGLGDAIGTHLVARWLEKRGVSVQVANSNYIGPSDVDGKNLVVVSSARFQTLLQKLKLKQKFRFNFEGTKGGYWLDDPQPGEQSLYQPQSGVGVVVDYAVLSLWPGSRPGTRILYISGTNTWSTQGAAQFALDDALLRNMQKRLESDPAVGPRGTKSPYFQVLLQVEGKNNRARNASYLSHRYLSVD